MIATALTAAILLYWVRLIVGVALISFFVICLIGNWTLFIFYLLRGRRDSMVPAGIVGAVGFVVMPYGGIFNWWWLPLILDFGLPVGLISAGLALVWHRRQDTRCTTDSITGEDNEH